MVDQPTGRAEQRVSKRRFALGFTAASALWITLILLVAYFWHTPDQGGRGTRQSHVASAAAARRGPVASRDAVIHDDPGTAQSVAALVSQRLASLHVPVKRTVLPAELALQAEIAIKQGDFATANRVASSVLAQSKVAGWRFYPFDSFMETIVGPGNDPQLARELQEWRQPSPTPPSPT